MHKHGIISGQRTNDDKIGLSRCLRKEMTHTEQVFWSKVRNGQIQNIRFRRQQIIDGFIVDFYCPKLKTVIELDGGVHDESEEYDKARDAILMRRGLRILRFKNEEVLEDINNVIAKIVGETPP